MRMSVTRARALLWPTLFLTGSVSAALPSFSCKTLAKQSGPARLSAVDGINNHDEVVGHSRAQIGDQQTATRWDSRRQMHDLRAWPDRRSCASLARAINDHGQVVGTDFDCDTHWYAILWADDAASRLAGVPDSTDRSEAFAISNKGWAVGTSEVYRDGSFFNVATLWKGGKAIELAPFHEAWNGYALAINDDGVVVGLAWAPVTREEHAVRWDAAGATELPPLPSGIAAEPDAINAAGTAVGVTTLATGHYRATAWRDGTPIDLGTLPGIEDSWAYAVNSAGWIVGSSWPDSNGQSVPVLWPGLGAGPVQLEHLIKGGGCRDSPGNLIKLAAAKGINDKGVIVVGSWGLFDPDFRLEPIDDAPSDSPR